MHCVLYIIPSRELYFYHSMTINETQCVSVSFSREQLGISIQSALKKKLTQDLKGIGDLFQTLNVGIDIL